MEQGISKSNSPKERWEILRTFIKNKNLNVREKRRHAFGLFTSRKITDFEKAGLENFRDSCEINRFNPDYEWLEYTCEQFPSCRLSVRQRARAVNWSDATGFDNTGNICVWPSEEILSYLCLKNSQDFRQKTVCELGAGMTGLAGMMLAVATDLQEVLITDGNVDGVTNLKEIAKKNKEKFGESYVNIRQLRWNENKDFKDLKCSFDYVLCADCLFYENVHNNLLDVMKTLLKSEGFVLIVSPRRGSTIEQFIEKAQKWFNCEFFENYDEFIWSEYCKEQGRSPSSEAVKNFPILIKMRKKPSITVEIIC